MKEVLKKVMEIFKKVYLWLAWVPIFCAWILIVLGSMGKLSAAFWLNAMTLYLPVMCALFATPGMVLLIRASRNGEKVGLLLVATLAALSPAVFPLLLF